MKRHSFFLKLFLGNFLLVVAIVVLAGVVSYRFLEDYYQRDSEGDQIRLLRMAQAYFEDRWPFDPGAIDAECKRLRGLLDKEAAGIGAQFRLTVIAADGHVLGESHGPRERMELHNTPDRPEVIAALRGEEGRGLRSSETFGTEYRYLALPIRYQAPGEDRAGIIAVVRVATPVQAIIQSRSFIANALLWSALSAAVVAVVLALLISFLWYVPLRQITVTARMIASGDLDRRARITGSAELAQLGAALNEMRDNLAHQIEVIAAQRGNLQTVVQSLREGVIALDAAGRVVLANRAALGLLAPGQEAVAGRHVQEVVRVAEIVELYERAQRTGEPATAQIEIERNGQRRVLDVHAGGMPTAGTEAIAALLVVRDVTALARTAQVKTEFVANASHELRTPLATLRAAVDSLADMGADDPRTFQRFMEILDRHVGRLEDMTNDLLDLHLVETARDEFHPTEISAGSVAEWAGAQFDTPAAEKDVTLEVSVADPGCTFRTDRKLLDLILQNLLDNAVKFTDAGGCVRLAVDRCPTGVRFRVSDTGCGIRPEEIDRVFERFYQADASRSGDARGTGLGLAIVKYAAERLGAEIDLASEPGVGTTATVILPARAAADAAAAE